MINQVGDWYRTTDLQNNDERLSQRRRSAEILVARWEKGSPNQIVDAVCLGLEAATSSTSSAGSSIEDVLNAITDEQPTFDRALGGSGMDPRICVLMSLGELLHRRAGKADTLRQKEPALVAAQALACALRLRSVNAGRFLDDRLQLLLEMADGLLNRLDQARRTRKSSPLTIGVIDPAKISDDVNSAFKRLEKALGEASANAALDREELQALWWVFGGYSTTQSKSFALLDPALSPLVAGVELSELISWPGTHAMGALASRVALLNQNPAPGSITGYSSHSTQSVRELCVPTAYASRLHNRDAIFPVLSAILMSSPHQSPKSLIREELSVGEVALQVFSERSLLVALEG